jgi:hypothetical protein
MNGSIGAYVRRGGDGNVPGVDHIDTVLERDANDIVLGEVGTDRREAFADAICLIGLLAMGRHAILVRVDRDGVHDELMGRPEHADRDFLAERYWYWYVSKVRSEDVRRGSRRGSL